MVIPEAGIGDVVRARTALHLGPAATGLAARMLHLELAEPATEFRAATSPPAPVRGEPDLQPPSPMPPPHRPAPDRAAAGRTVRHLTPVAHVPWGPPGSAPRDPLPPVVDANVLPVLPHAPLLRHGASRDVLEVLAATWQPTGAVATDRVLADVVARRPVLRIHRLHRPSLAQGLQVLVDLGEGMQPFRRDQRHVVAALHRLLGPGLTVLRYRDEPWEGAGVGRPAEWSPGYRPPPPGQPVLVLGSLGLGAPARPDLAEGWLRFHRLLAGRGSRLAALVPVPPRLWSSQLARTLLIVPWDTTTRRRHLGRLETTAGARTAAP